MYRRMDLHDIETTRASTLIHVVDHDSGVLATKPPPRQIARQAPPDNQVHFHRMTTSKNNLDSFTEITPSFFLT